MRMPAFDLDRSAQLSLYAMVFTALTSLPLIAGSAETPQAVSPGDVGAAVGVAQPCPTFSWSGVPEARGYELALYRVVTNGTLKIVHRVEIDGDARTWSPAAEQCLLDSSEYGWSVRGITDTEPTSWSPVLFFETAATSSPEALRWAIETLRRDRRSSESVGDRRDTDSVRTGQAPLPDSSHDHAPMLEPGQTGALSVGTVSGAELEVIDVPTSYALRLDADLNLTGRLFSDPSPPPGDETPFIHADGGLAGHNTAIGLNALISLTPTTADNSAFGFEAMRYTSTGADNTAFGHRALRENQQGLRNSALGSGALFANTSGDQNAAMGRSALGFNTEGERNTAVGAYALLQSSTGSSNTAFGYRSLGGSGAASRNTAVGHQALANTSAPPLYPSNGGRNTGFGSEALFSNTSGSENVAVGVGAGSEWATGDTNIAIGAGSAGSAGESGTIRIGGAGMQNFTYIEGVAGAITAGGVPVLINSSNQLGTSTSSARFKQAIRDLEGVTDSLMALRPVRFRYLEELARGGANPIEYGLIAEEVASVMPELVVRDERQRPLTVRYRLLAPLLLRAFQEQQAVIRGRELASGHGVSAEGPREDHVELDRSLPTPDPVSPGSAASFAMQSGSCPTFSWAAVENAIGYEIRVREEDSTYAKDDSAPLVVRTQLSGDARAWTPASADCPAQNGRYSWTVRAIQESGVGPWSGRLLFATPAEPSIEELHEVLTRLSSEGVGELSDRTLDRSGSPSWLETGGEQPSALHSVDTPPQVVVPPADFSLTLRGELGVGGAFFLQNQPFIHSDGGSARGNTAAGINALTSLNSGSGFRNSAFGFGALRKTTTGNDNTSLGRDALYGNTTGSANTSVGYRTLAANLSASRNTGFGHRALRNSTTGSSNTAAGRLALFTNTTGHNNTAIGYRALFSNGDGTHNTAVGYKALENNSSGHYNTAIGDEAMSTNTTGSFNTAIGPGAGANWTTGDNNIAIGRGAYGVAGESGVIRIGGNNQQTQTFIEGIHGAYVVGGVTVNVNGADLLGTGTASSYQYKEQLEHLDEEAVAKLLALRPVSFRYRDDLVSGANPIEYGLIAEDVAETLPDLLVRDADGNPFSVRYTMLLPMLIRALQQQEVQIRRREDVIRLREEELSRLRSAAEHHDTANLPLDRAR